jgi:rod shape-determining protein MreC
MLLNKKNSKILFLVLVIFFLFVFIFLQRPVRSFFYSVSQPIQQWFWSKGLENSSFWSGLFNAKDLKTENNNLKKENQLFLSKIVEFEQLKEENRKLRKVLDLGLTEELKLLETNILSRDTAKDFIVINRGIEDGLKEKMVVINYEKVLVGQIDEVYKNSSKVRLLTDNKMKFSVKIIDTDIQALANGQGNQKMLLELIPKDEEILSGALVVTSGLERKFPLGFLVGKIERVEKTDLTPFQKVEISPLFNLQGSNLLFVIIN